MKCRLLSGNRNVIGVHGAERLRTFSINLPTSNRIVSPSGWCSISIEPATCQQLCSNYFSREILSGTSLHAGGHRMLDRNVWKNKKLTSFLPQQVSSALGPKQGDGTDRKLMKQCRRVWKLTLVLEMWRIDRDFRLRSRLNLKNVEQFEKLSGTCGVSDLGTCFQACTKSTSKRTQKVFWKALKLLQAQCVRIIQKRLQDIVKHRNVPCKNVPNCFKFNSNANDDVKVWLRYAIIPHSSFSTTYEEQGLTIISRFSCFIRSEINPSSYVNSIFHFPGASAKPTPPWSRCNNGIYEKIS